MTQKIVLYCFEDFLTKKYFFNSFHVRYILLKLFLLYVSRYSREQ
jgi:hypothetical protein